MLVRSSKTKFRPTKKIIRYAPTDMSAPAAPSLMVRGVLYTAITRARELLVLVGDDTVPAKMAENDRRQRRYSGLRRRLKDLSEQA